ncbi:sensor of ECF-type sigma factor [Winogradskyella maritima]|uniref:Sensor of ECF-type sigma factor n=1 Tax=Winogradskyella maritima TaxID=1517766 RepID=A0ABV8AHB3_9FLAO|nr:sensor of ECF-type sigma factor [Winogradskyella maritima]
MKKIMTIVLLSFLTFGFAQRDREGMRDKIKAQKVAFITEKLSLTVEESQGFWPIYNKFDETMHQIKRKDMREIKMKIRQSENLSDADADNLLNQYVSAEKKMHEAKMKMIQELKNVIPSAKIIRLRAAEDEFNKKLLERLREFRKGKGRD